MARALRDLPTRSAPTSTCPCSPAPTASSPPCAAATRAASTVETVALLRAHVPDLALTTDVIVGYPGETEAEFEETVDLVEEVGFDGLFVFMYSPRPGTTALRLADDVPEDEKLRRLQVLNAMQQRLQHARNRGRDRQPRSRCWSRHGTRRGPRLGPDAALPHRPLRRRRASLIGRWWRSRSPPPAPNALAGKRRRRKQFVDGGFRRSYILIAGPSEVGMQIEMTIKGLMIDPITNMPDHHPPRTGRGSASLPIWVGVFEANAIALQIENVQTPAADDPRPR